MNEDGDLRIDPKVARVLLMWREEVAQATEAACISLRELGVPQASIDRFILGSPSQWPRPSEAPRAR